MSMYFMILFYFFSWCFKFTLCKHVRLSYVFLINLLTYLLVSVVVHLAQLLELVYVTPGLPHTSLHHDMGGVHMQFIAQPTVMVN